MELWVHVEFIFLAKENLPNWKKSHVGLVDTSLLSSLLMLVGISWSVYSINDVL